MSGVVALCRARFTIYEDTQIVFAATGFEFGCFESRERHRVIIASDDGDSFGSDEYLDFKNRITLQSWVSVSTSVH